MYYENSAISPKEAAKQCKQQCYGYGETGECKSSFFALEVPTPEGYMGTAGGELMNGCLMFTQFLDPEDFVAAEDGQYLNAKAANIDCPAR